jgi:hypothetical protein
MFPIVGGFAASNAGLGVKNRDESMVIVVLLFTFYGRKLWPVTRRVDRSRRAVVARGDDPTGSLLSTRTSGYA